ncbi:MAG: type II toxin-antitoxin system HicB family antitoxin [Treponema sp.]|nr:type II toxin-antitoxin system HicB family antitoxin [Treponema sp.]MBQ6567379.1 type II toxin-antitoxin system HicB family antitoxin [Treponema sp.]MBQ7165743.1 type II toxin-antitoxin system HicB family antitoxin [Treponema sp.]
MNIVYPAVCHFEDNGYWCDFPDLDGCFSQGDSEKEIVENAKEALEGYAFSILERGERLPKASAITSLHAEGKDFLTYISCDISNRGKFVRKNVTIPEWLSVQAEKASINFSQTLQESLIQKLGITA